MDLGRDVHVENIAVALAEAGRDGEVRNYGMISSDLHAVDKLVRKLGHPGKGLRVCYEAGPCGFVRVRGGLEMLEAAGAGEGVGKPGAGRGLGEGGLESIEEGAPRGFGPEGAEEAEAEAEES